MFKSIAILGATGHVGNILVYYLSKNKNYRIVCYIRSVEKINKFIKNFGLCFDNIDIKSIEDFGKDVYDIVINCLGFGNPSMLKSDVCFLFEITEKYDNVIIQYLIKNKECKYINFSSGAIYGNNFFKCGDENTLLDIEINNIENTYYYTLIKLNSEVKHRAFGDLNIIDLRLFAIYSRFINLKYKYFMVELINAIKDDKVFNTDKNNFIRDFISPIDLVSLVEIFFNINKVNDAFDIYSLNPISKFRILDIFKLKYGLIYNISQKNQIVSATGLKENYYSKYWKAQRLGYVPKYTSEEVLMQETEMLIKNIQIRKK